MEAVNEAAVETPVETPVVETPVAPPKKEVKKAPPKKKPAAKKKAAPKKKAVKKTAKKKATPKKTAKKVGGKPKVQLTDKQKTMGLRKPQVRILDALKSGVQLSRKQISEKANCDLAWLNAWIGHHDETQRKLNDANGFPCLLTLKFLKFAPSEGQRGAIYQITAAGKKYAS